MSTEAVPTEDVVETVRSRYDNLTSSQKRIAEAIVEDPEFVAFATVDKLANRLGVAASTIVRFAYKLDLDGYQDLQARVRTQVRRQYRTVSDGDGDTTPTAHLGDSPFALSLGRDLANLQRTIRGLDIEALERTVVAIDEADHVYVSGDLTSYSLAYFTAIALGRARDHVRLVRADAEGATALLDMGDGDVLLAFTFPPYSRSVLRVVDWAARCGALTVGVTDAAISPVGQRVEIVHPAVASGVGPQNTLVPGLAVANAIVNAVIVRNEDRSLERYRSINAMVSDWDLFVLGTDDGA